MVGSWQAFAKSLIKKQTIITAILYKSQRSKEQQGCTTKEQRHEENKGDR